jgi:hypothetical protein
MNKKKCPYALIVCIALLAATGLFAQVNTVVRLPATSVSIPSFKVIPVDAANLLVSAESTTAKDMSFVQFDLSGIPADATIVSFALRITLSADPSDRTSVVVHQVVNDDMNAPVLSDQIDSKSIQKEDNPKNSVILLANMPVGVLQQALRKKKLTLRLSTTFRNGSAAFYSSKLTQLPVQQQDPAFIPRLVVAYTPEPAPVTWAAYRADARHTGMSSAIFAGSSPFRYAVKEITEFNGIQKNMVLYKDKVYLVAMAGLSSYHLYSIDPVTKEVTQAASNLRVPSVMGAVDPWGRYFHITDSIIVINLEAGNAIGPRMALPSGALVKAPPTVGRDGSLYLATRTYIHAYSPHPRYDLLWQYAAPSESMSAVTLSADGATAYVVFGDPLKLAAINTVSGDGRELVLDRTPGVGRGGGMIPVVNNQGQLFVTDGFPSGKTLYVVNRSLTLDTTIHGVNISQPVIGGDGTVYYADKGNLMSYTKDNTVLEFAKGVGEVANMITDAGNNIYCWNKENRLLGFEKNGTQFLDSDKPLGNLSREWDMTLATDGSLYTGTSTRLYGIRPAIFTPVAYSFTKDDLMYNNRVFRADLLTVPAGLNFEAGYSTTLTGARSVILNQVVKAGSTTRVVSGGTIVFNAGFKVETGAQLSCKTGY